jgi:hypothetical protein
VALNCGPEIGPGGADCLGAISCTGCCWSSHMQ